MRTNALPFTCASLLAALTFAGSLRADLTNVTTAAEAQTRGGTFADYNFDELSTNYLFVKYNSPSLDTARKVYLQFDLTGAGPDTVNQPATLTIKGYANSQRQRVKLWALNQSYPGFSPNLTWNTAQANETTSNDLLTNPTNTYTATLVDDVIALGGSGTLNSFTLPKPWGKYVLGGKLVLVLTGGDHATNQANGLRFAVTNATLSFNNTVGNQPVAFSGVTNQALYSGQAGTNYFTVSDDTTPATDIIVWADSSNESLISASTFVNTGYGVSGQRSLEYASSSGLSGTVTITLHALDNLGLETTTTFTVTVQPSVSVSSVPHQFTLVNTPTPPTTLAVNSAVAPANSITVSGVSGNLGLVLDTGIAVTGSGTGRNLVVTPVGGQTGVAPVTLVARDGVGNSNTTAFATMVLPDAETVFCDHFGYADGFLNPLSADFWALRTSGTTRLTVTNQQAVLRSSGGSWESLLAPLAGGPYTTGSRSVFYAHCTASWTALPRNSTGPFLHLYETAGNLLAKVHTVTNNLPDGLFRLGIASGPGNVYQDLATDLTTNVTYSLVARYDMDAGTAALWINATSEADAHISASDVPAASSLTSVGLRQQAGMGTILVDDLKVTRTVRPAITGIQVTGTMVEITFTAGSVDQAADFVVARAAEVTGPYTNAPASITATGSGAFKAVVPVNGSQGFFQVLRVPLAF